MSGLGGSSEVEESNQEARVWIISGTTQVWVYEANVFMNDIMMILLRTC